MLRHPECHSRQEFSAQLGTDERQHQHRSHTERIARNVAWSEPTNESSIGATKATTMLQIRLYVAIVVTLAPKHTDDHHGCHRNRSQDTNHGPLRQQRIEPDERQVNHYAAHDLKCQQPDMQHLHPHLPRLHPTESENSIRKISVGVIIPFDILGRCHRTA